MKQKKTWMRFLTIGISFAILLTSSRCKSDVGPLLTRSSYVYINSTDHDIDMIIFDRGLSSSRGYLVSNSFLIKPNDSICFQMYGKGAYPFYHPVEGSVSGDSAVIKKDNKFIMNHVNYSGIRDGSGIFHLRNYDNYADGILDKDEFTLYYTFKEHFFNFAINYNKNKGSVCTPFYFNSGNTN